MRHDCRRKLYRLAKTSFSDGHSQSGPWYIARGLFQKTFPPIPRDSIHSVTSLLYFYKSSLIRIYFPALVTVSDNKRAFRLASLSFFSGSLTQFETGSVRFRITFFWPDTIPQVSRSWLRNYLEEG